MFGEWDGDQKADQIERRILAKEAEICRLRSEQAEDLRLLDRLQVDLADGDRGMTDWVSSHLDVSHQTAMRLMQIARADDRRSSGRCGQAGGVWTGPPCWSAWPGPLLLPTCWRKRPSIIRWVDCGLVLQRRGLSAADEQASFESRYLVIQPSLDEQMFKLWGLLPAVDGRIVEKALAQQETRLPVLPGEGHGQRRVDALTAICLDSLTGSSEDSQEQNGTGRAVTVAEIFIDGHLAAANGGEAGVSTSSGLRVGPATLAEILCADKIRVIYTDQGRPIARLAPVRGDPPRDS